MSTTPTPGALRAARPIYFGNSISTGCLDDDDTLEAYQGRQITRLAQIIDRETGLPELIAAITYALESVECCGLGGSNRGREKELERQLRSALAKHRPAKSAGA